MFTCVHGGTEAAPTIALIDDLTLDHCREIHAELLRRLPARELRIDLSATEKSDLSFLQTAPTMEIVVFISVIRVYGFLGSGSP